MNPHALPVRAVSRRVSIRKRMERGQASLEMLIVLIILIPLIFGGFELSRGIAVRSALDSSIGVAVRALSLDPGQWDWAGDLVTNTVDTNVFGAGGISNIAMHTADTACSDTDAACLNSLNFGESFCLTGSADFTPDIPLLTPSVIPIEVEQCGIMEYMR